MSDFLKRPRLPAGIDGSRLDLWEEFRLRTFGKHSPDLQALLDYMRGGPITGKYFLKLTGPHSEWTLARFSDTFPLTTHTLPEHVFTTIEDAEFFVFRRRWEEMFGADPGAGS
ncbi:MAG: hypothetical protein J4G00_10460 [Actinomycetia bacterium]|nr:hypothetical protein [Actinomycetes bacterium]